MQALIEALVEGPNAAEVEQRLHSAVPSDIEVLSVELDDGVVDIDLSSQVLDTPPADLQLAVAQIVLTATELRGDRSVIIRVNGTAESWPNGAGRDQSTPLTIYDFPDYAQSSQPPFPHAAAAGRDDEHHDGADAPPRGRAPRHAGGRDRLAPPTLAGGAVSGEEDLGDVVVERHVEGPGLADGELERCRHDLGAAQHHHLPPPLGVDEVDRRHAEARGQHAVVRRRRAATLHVAEHHDAGLEAGAFVELAGDDVGDAAEAHVPELVVHPLAHVERAGDR